jgi:hypothetical protein
MNTNNMNKDKQKKDINDTNDTFRKTYRKIQHKTHK